MKKIPKRWIVVAALLFSATAVATTTLVAHAVYGLKLLPQSSIPSNCATTGNLCVWTKSSDNNLYFRNASGSDVNISNPGTGTVTSVGTSNGLTGGTITTTGTVSLALKPLSSSVDWSAGKGCSGSLGSNFNTGVNFWPSLAMTATGARFWLPAGANTSVTASLFDITAGGGALTSSTVSVTAGAINTINFGTVSIPQNGHEYAVTVFNGHDQIAYCPGNPGNTSGVYPQSYGILYTSGGYCSGSNCAINQAQTSYTGVELLYTVP